MCAHSCLVLLLYLFFFNDTATTEIYTLSLHDALPIWRSARRAPSGRSTGRWSCRAPPAPPLRTTRGDRKSTRLNSSHSQISYAVFCLKKKKKKITAHKSTCSNAQHQPTEPTS